MSLEGDGLDHSFAERVAAADAEFEQEMLEYRYMTPLLEEQYDTLREVFIAQGTPKDKLGEIMFRRNLHEALNWIVAEGTRFSGVLVDYFRPDQLDEKRRARPLARIGWMDYYPAFTDEALEKAGVKSGEERPYIPAPTEAGIAVVDRLRELQGQLTIDEQRRIGRERWELMFGQRW
jgi:hypothetical protein